jgi:2-oxoglutarate dehydrogenase E1 component
MGHIDVATPWNLDIIEDAYRRWRADPAAVDPSWRHFFEGFELGSARAQARAGPAAPAPVSADGHLAVGQLIRAYRDLGHYVAHLDPLSRPPAGHPMLALSEFGLGEADLDRTFDTSLFVGLPRATLRQLVAALRETYCRTIGVEFLHIQDTRIRRWLQERMEPRRNRPNFDRDKKVAILQQLHYAEMFERFLHTRYIGQKRFSLEGAETLIPILEALVERAPELGVAELVLGMAHRGRLNVLANTLRKPYQEVFAEFEENYLPESIDGDGDVKYHLGFSSHRTTAAGQTIHISLTPNPSHLEAVDPVVEGRARAKQRVFGDEDRRRGIPLLIHGDAAFAGQGLVAETLNLSQLAGYTTGGTVHIIVNNQIGFTTGPADARSTTYCTDVAKMLQVPIFHVNAEDPEAAVYVTELALDFRQTFHRDVVIDMVCYRRHGHNEADEPSFTQPLMYEQIRDRPTLTEVFTERLILQGDLTVDETESVREKFQSKLREALDEVRTHPARPRTVRSFSGPWKGLTPTYSHRLVETGAPLEALAAVAEVLTRIPEGFNIHPKLAKLLETRRRHFEAREPLDWAFVEALAFGTLMQEGVLVRLSGQDSRRGTFSQRHAVLYDAETGEPYYLLEGLGGKEAPFLVYDSLLSESAVLGFEYGYSLDTPNALVMWEAQFGDFANGAQVIIDQFIASGYSKWQRDSGVVLLLPHGYEGQGPEHSSARLERFLQLCAEDNLQVCYPSTPAQYFHVLRRQMKRTFRKPLVLMTPKSLLRHKAARSPIDALTRGHFREVIDDEREDPAGVHRVVLCSGKLYYELAERREKEEAGGEVALVRVEQFYPFHEDALRRVLERYGGAEEWVWVQEESQNMGAWSFMESHLRAMGHPPAYVGRDASASPATGSLKVHRREQEELVEAALVGPVPHIVSRSPGRKRQGDKVTR